MATIFERYGGFATIRKVVSAFYDRVLESPVISHHFESVDMRALIQHQTQFISFVTGGPGTNYSDDALLRLHGPLGVTPTEFDEMRVLLRETLEDLEFEPMDIDTIDAEISKRRSAIVVDP
jgi:hemoglobin